MATPTKPTAHPDWTTGDAAQVAAPSPSQQASGFTEGQRPTYQLFNWLFWLNGQWTEYLDAQTASNTQYTTVNPLVRMVGGGYWSFNATSGALSWSDTAYIAIPGLADAVNTVAAGSVTLTAGQVAYVETNPTASSAQPLAVQVANSASLTPDLNTIIVARCIAYGTYSSQVMVGVNAGQMLVRDAEQKVLLEAGYDAVERISAGQALAAGNVVYVSADASGSRTKGAVYPADASAANGANRAKALGFVISACASGAEAHVVRSGIVRGLSGLTAGLPVYLDPANPGAITQTLPTAVGAYVVPLGVALTATSMRFNAAAAEMAVAIQNGLTVNGPLSVNGMTTLKPGAAGKTLSLYDAAGQVVVGTVDNAGAATFASSVTTGTVQATTAISSPSFVSTTGFKNDIYMGYCVTTPGANTFDYLLASSNNPRLVAMAFAGSVVGIGITQFTGNSAQHSVRLYKNNGILVTATNITTAAGQGSTATQVGTAKYSKGTYSFAAGDYLYAMVAYSNGAQLQASVDITVEYAA